MSSLVNVNNYGNHDKKHRNQDILASRSFHGYWPYGTGLRQYVNRGGK